MEKSGKGCSRLITLNATRSDKRDVQYHAPVSGKVVVVRTMPGLFSASVSTIAEFSNKTKSPSTAKCNAIGSDASYYGKDFSGKGVITSQTTIKDGGENATPYTQEVQVFTGVSEDG